MLKNTTRYPGTGGFTLLEVLIASVLIALAVAVGVHALLVGIGVNSRTLTQGTVQEQARQCLEVMVREFKDSGEGCTGWAVGVNPNPADQYYDQDVTQISFSRCTGYDPSADLLEWGPIEAFRYQPAQGAEPGKVVKVAGGGETVICDSASDFRMKYLRDEGSIELTLTVLRADPQSPGHYIRASHTTSVKLRN